VDFSKDLDLLVERESFFLACSVKSPSLH